MYTLLIVDDEKEVRDAISRLIDWEKLGIRLIGSAGNGVEGLNIILDEYPDIVMTDIRMPGLSGIDLIRKASAISGETKFIILTGYGELEYAKQAMQFGVKHYLLKPCDEEEIIASIRQICAELDQREHHLADGQKELLQKLEAGILSSFLRDGLNRMAGEHYETLFKQYGAYLDFAGETCSLLYVYYLTQENLQGFLRHMKEKGNSSGIYVLYVKNTLLLFGRKENLNVPALTDWMKQYQPPHQSVDIETMEEEYEELRGMMEVILAKVRRYEMVYFGQDYELAGIENQTGVQMQLEELLKRLIQSPDGEKEAIWKTICEIIHNIGDRQFLCRIAASVLTRTAIEGERYSIVEACRVLERMEESQDMERIKQMLLSDLEKILNVMQNTQNGISGQIEDYVEHHLEDTSLSLKWIAEHVLFMNVDYVSKKFVKETGRKFSAFLAEKRIRRAKELLMLYGDQMTLNEIAEKIGCGNNPQYFGQLFKKVEGISPGAYKERYLSGKQQPSG